MGACSCVSCIDTGSVGLVQTCGDVTEIQDPGFRFVVPLINTVRPVSLAVRQLISHSDCKTKDNVTLKISCAVQYRIVKDKVKEAVYGVLNAESMIQAEVDNTLRSALPTMTMDESYEAKEKLVNHIVKTLQVAMCNHGYEVINVLITDIRPPQSVADSMNEINAASRLLEATTAKAEAEKILKVKASEADAEAMRLSGVGMAGMRAEIAKGFHDSMKLMKESGLSEQDAMTTIMMTQYFDTLKEFSSSHGTVIVPHGPSAVKDIEAQIREGLLSAHPASSSKIAKSS